MGLNAAFVGGDTPSESVAVYLASMGMDVWGIDLDWTLVPSGTTDLSFMQGWGLQRDIDEVEEAMEFARLTRGASGSCGAGTAVGVRRERLRLDGLRGRVSVRDDR
jgi:hypothetical protein